MNIGIILARKETEEDGSGKDKIIAKKISPGSLSSQVYIAVLQAHGSYKLSEDRK